MSIVDVPEMSFLMIDVEGDPNTSQKYQDSIEALFSIYYKAKFISEKENSQDYVVMPLEGLWWIENPEEFTIQDKSGWKWTAMIRQPNFIKEDMIKRPYKKLKKGKNCLHFQSIYRLHVHS